MRNPLEQLNSVLPNQGEALPLAPQMSTIEHLHDEALKGESFEDAAEALESVEVLQAFRARLKNAPFCSFHELVEEVTNIRRLAVSKEERAGKMEALIETLEQKAARLSPRAADLYLGILAEIKGEQFQPRFDITKEKITELKSTADEKGNLKRSDLDILFAGDTSWDIKLNRIETRFDDRGVGYLSGMRALDRRDREEMSDDIRKWREEELKKAMPRPPGRRNESKPGVDSMERLKEGERVPAYWTIEPGFDGTKYFKEQSFSSWDSERNVWVEEEYKYSDVELSPLLEKDKEDPKRGLVNITMSSTINAGDWISCPIPYTHRLHAIDTNGRKYSVQQDQNGDVVILIEGSGEVEVKVILGVKEDRRLISQKPKKPTVPNMLSEFSEETIKKLAEIKKRKNDNISRARMISAYVRSRVKYLAPKDRAEADKYNAFYNTHAKGFAGAVDEIREGDCDVVNTYFAALCAKLNIPVRHVVGHSVKGRDNEGRSSIHSGTGHGWSEVYDEIRNEWVLIDATPQGDSNLEDEREKGGRRPSDYVAGDNEGHEAVRPSDEKLEELRKKLAEHKEQLSYTKEERQLAAGAGIELKEARKAVKEIDLAERTRLPSGELIVDALTKLFNAIVESRKMPTFGYTGPVRQSEGGEEIEDMTSHYIQAKSGDMDPRSRNLPSKEIKNEQIIGGFHVYMIGDKSGSMGANTEEGESLWQMQRRAMYLIFSSLHRFERNIERAGLQKENALSIQTESISFRGESQEEIDLDKPLSAKFSAEDKVKLWHSLTTQGSGNGDVTAIATIYDQIKKEVEETEKRGVKDNCLRLIVACSDGGYCGTEGQMQAYAEALHKLNAVVVGVGLTEAAASVKVVMENPPVSRGDTVRDINDLPALVAKYLVMEAIKLFPLKARENAAQVIESSMAKFNPVN